MTTRIQSWDTRAFLDKAFPKDTHFLFLTEITALFQSRSWHTHYLSLWVNPAYYLCSLLTFWANISYIHLVHSLFTLWWLPGINGYNTHHPQVSFWSCIPIPQKSFSHISKEQQRSLYSLLKDSIKNLDILSNCPFFHSIFLTILTTKPIWVAQLNMFP